MTPRDPRHFVLSVYPTSYGFAFVLFEGLEAPFDWGVKQIREKRKNARTVDEVKKLIDRYHPEALVFEKTTKNSRRVARILRLYRMLLHLGHAEGVEVLRYPKTEVRALFAQVGATSKYEIAKAIATQIPAFMHRLPPVRKIWMSEDPRQSLFDAAALGLTYYSTYEEADKGRRLNMDQ